MNSLMDEHVDRTYICLWKLRARVAYLVVNPIIADGYASLFNCTTAFRASDSMTTSSQNLTSGFGLDDMYLAWPAVVQLLVFIYSGIQYN